MSKLSVVIITFNEEENIERCIASVKAMADEIIVLDSFSYDKTVALAKKSGVKILQQKFEGFTLQKQRAAALAQYDFVFSIDADEAVSEELQQSVIAEKQNGFTADAYEMNRLNFLGSRAVKTCGLYPDTKIRIWNKHKGGWQGGHVHEQMQMQKDASVKKLNGDLLHYTYKDAKQLAIQMEKFARLAAQDLKQENVFFLFSKMLFSAPFKFLRSYILKLGLTDGAVGFSICYQQSRGVFLKYWYALQLIRH